MKQLLLGLQGKGSPSLLPPTLHPPTHPAKRETEVEQVTPPPVLFVSGTLGIASVPGLPCCVCFNYAWAEFGFQCLPPMHN